MTWKARARLVGLLKAVGPKCFLCDERNIDALMFRHQKGAKLRLTGHVLERVEDYSLLLREARKCLVCCLNCNSGLNAGRLITEIGALELQEMVARATHGR